MQKGLFDKFTAINACVLQTNWLFFQVVNVLPSLCIVCSPSTLTRCI
jgi:hypothetical protein